jgi:hypothetical protein
MRTWFLATTTSGLLLGLALSPRPASGNGAAHESTNYQGNEILVADRRPGFPLSVDEEVMINLFRNRVTVKYFITNLSTKPVGFDMLFPIPQGDWTADTLESPTLQATMNGVTVPTTQVDLDKVALEGEYAKLRQTNHLAERFPVKLKPGANTLRIEYGMESTYVGSSETGVMIAATYDIWPAKNWVRKFGRAVFRIVPPSVEEMEFDDESEGETVEQVTLPSDQLMVPWLQRFADGVERKVIAKGPGIPRYTSNLIEFSAVDFVPDGRIEVSFTATLWKDCLGQYGDTANPNCIEELREILAERPYAGAARAYEANDFWLPCTCAIWACESTDVIRSHLRILRNEIFARHHQRFSGREIQDFFDEMPWYEPRETPGPLTEIEWKNVALIQKLEKASPSRYEYLEGLIR